jgi:hypothetical protein
MAKDAIVDYDASTPINNSDIGGISTAEGWAPSTVNNAIRELLSQIKDASQTLITTGGSANTYTLTMNQAPTAYATGQWHKCAIHAANTGGSTINVNGLGAKTIKAFLGVGAAVALVGGEMPIGHPAELVYDGTDFLLMNPVPKYAVIQRQVTSVTGIFGTGTLTPFDDTIPQITEGGDLSLDVAITPRYSDTSIRLSWMLPTITLDTNNAVAIFHIHKDSDADAIFACPVHQRVASTNMQESASGFILVDSTDTSARTYKPRMGPSAGNVWVNADNGSSILGTSDNTRWFMAEEIYAD